MESYPWQSADIPPFPMTRRPFSILASLTLLALLVCLHVDTSLAARTSTSSRRSTSRSSVSRSSSSKAVSSAARAGRQIPTIASASSSSLTSGGAFGAEVVSSKYGFRLTPVIVGSPAYLAGIRPGATLKAIDAQEPLNTQPLSELQALLNGKANTSVSVTFNDPLTTREQTVSVKRTWMDVPPVQVEISGSTAVVRIHALDAKSVDTIRQELSAADLSVVVLQMDAEPGGTVEGVVQLLSLLLPTDTPLFQAHSAGGSVSHKALGGQLFTKTIVTAIAANSPSTTLSGLVSQTLEQVAGSRTLHLLVQGSDGLLTVDPVLRDAQGTAVFPAWRSISGQSPTPTTASGKQRLEGAITFATSDLRDPLRTDVRKTERSQLLTDLATLLKTAK